MSVSPYDTLSITWPEGAPEPCVEMPSAYEPPDDPDLSQPPSQVDFCETTGYWETMGAMTAETDAEVLRQAEEEARHVAEMQTEMALFYRNLPRLDGGDALHAADSTDMPSSVPLEEMIDTAVTSSNERSHSKSPAGSWTGELIPSEEPPVERAASANVPAAEWTRFDMRGLTVSGVVPLQSTEVEIPTYTMSTVDVTLPPPPEPQLPGNLVTTVSAIQGGVYDPAVVWAAQQRVVESPRWTDVDRAAKMAAAAAYDVDDGGLLPTIGVAYGPNAEESRYGQWGFSAHLTYCEQTQTYYLAFRGTEDLLDVMADVNQGWFMRSSQFDQAKALAKEVKQKLGDVPLVLTGHSLGGALAATAAYATGVNATVFNPASVSVPYRSALPVQIRSHVIFGEILSVGRTISNGIPSGDIPDPKVRFAPGMIILHMPRSVDPFQWHSLSNFPD